MDVKILKVCKNTENAIMPTTSTKYSAGLDFYSAYRYTIPPYGKEIVDTELKIELPRNTYGRLAGRSNYSYQNHISVNAGVCDADYRGTIKFLIFNHANRELIIPYGQKIGQMVIEKIVYPVVRQVDEEALTKTERGIKGFTKEFKKLMTVNAETNTNQ